MKKLIVIMLAVGIWFPALAQESQSLFEQLTDKYAQHDGFSASMLTNDMFDLYLKKKNIEEESEVAEALRGLDQILVVSQSHIQEISYRNRSRSRSSESGTIVYSETNKPEKQGKDEGGDLHKEILNHYKTSSFSLLKTEKRMGEDVKVYIKKSNEDIQALALVTKSSMSTSLIELSGDIDLSNVASLSKAINLRGLENLYKIDNSSTYLGRFPDIEYQSQLSEERIAEMEERARKMAERHAKLSDEQLAQIEKQAQIQAQKQMEMAEKYRQMAEQYGRQPIFLSTPGDTSTVYYINGKEVDAKNVKELLKEEDIKQVSKISEDGKTIIKIKTR